MFFHKLKKFALILVLLIPVFSLFGNHDNPSVENTVAWDSPATAERFRASCADCHSHETKWPWYSYIAPASWMAIHNVNEAREEFNISLKDMGEAHEAGEEVLEGEMPPFEYLLLHPEAKLSDEERKVFAEGLVNTFGHDG